MRTLAARPRLPDEPERWPARKDSATSGLMQCSTGEQHQRHVEAEALGRLEIDHHAANASSTITGMLIACSNPFSRRLSIQRLAAVHCMASQNHSACDHRACEPNILEFAISHRVQLRNRRLLGFPTPISHQPAPKRGNNPRGPELPCALRRSVPARNRSYNHHEPSIFCDVGSGHNAPDSASRALM